MAGGEVDPLPAGTETFLLVANTSPFATSVRVTLLFEDGTAPATRVFLVHGTSRFNVAVGHEFPEAAGRRFGAVVESLDFAAQLVVERAIYANALGQPWAAGSNILATPLP